jgi:predicted phosphodiesterase
VFLVDVEKRTSADGVFNLYAIGDLHSERKEFNRPRFERWRDTIIADPHAIVICVGDFTEGRTPGMKHFDPACLRAEFLTNLDSFQKHSLEYNARLLKPLTDAGVPTVVVEGNHDRYLEWSGYAPMLADRIGAHYLGGEGFVRIRTGGPRPNGPANGSAKRKGNPDALLCHTTVVYATHGSGGGKQPGGKVNAMQAQLQWLDADVVVAGHVHDGHARVIHRYGVKRRGALEMTKSPVAMYRAPSFVERSIPGLVSYAGRKGYPASDEGLQWFRVNPGKQTMTRHELAYGPDLSWAASA